MVSEWVKPIKDDAKVQKKSDIRTRTYNVMKHKNEREKVQTNIGRLFTGSYKHGRFENLHFVTFRNREAHKLNELNECEGYFRFTD